MEEEETTRPIEIKRLTMENEEEGGSEEDRCEGRDIDGRKSSRRE